MNTVKLNNSFDFFEKGDLFIKDFYNESVYMLCQIGDNIFSLVNLKTGNRYSEPGTLSEISSIIKERGCFKFLGRASIIEITTKK